jgi:hypothetical protein
VLSEQGKKPEAVNEFKITLQCDSTDTEAKEQLEKIEKAAN